MSKALRFVWLSLLTLVCGIASAGTVVFDPTTDVSSGNTITKDGVTITLSTGTFAASSYNGTTCYEFSQGATFEFSVAEPAGNLTSVTLEYQSSGGYAFDRNYTTSTEKLANGTKTTVKGSEGAATLTFSAYNGAIYVTKITVDYLGEGGGTGGETPEFTISELAAGAADVSSATINFTDAQVVYANGNNYIVRENGLALDLTNTSLSLELGATLNGKVTMSFAYNGGIMQASDIDGVTNADNLTQTNATYAMNPVTTTPANLTGYKGDLVKLEQVTLYQDTYNDFGMGKDAYYIKTGYALNAYLSNAADFSDKLTDLSKKYDLIAWYNAPGKGMVPATLQIVTIPDGQGEVAPTAPVITGEAEFTESTLVTITAEADAKVYYTTDGSTPTQESTLYAEPFTLTETTTVKAIAVRGSLSSDVAEATFTKKAAQVEGKTIAELAEGAADVAAVAINFTDAQVVYANGNNYIVRENGLALDLTNTSLSLELGATLNGKVTMSFAYNGGIMQASDIDGVTNADNLTQTNATYAMNPVTTTPANLTGYKGDLVKLEQVTLYQDTYNDFGMGKDAYYIKTGYALNAYLSNAADFSDKLTDLSKKYDLIAWYNAPGKGMVPATLQIVTIPDGQGEVAPTAPVITGEAEFTESTLVTITAEADAKVYYTTDGSTPTQESTLYAEPFTLTETTTVKAIAVRGSLSSDVAEATFTKKAAQVEGKTIAELAEAGTSEDNVTLKLTNAKVVYAEPNNYVVRENGKAIDLMNTSLTLQQGAFLTGTVKVNVTYTKGILSTTDIEGQTNSNALTITAGADTLVDAISCGFSEVENYPGDVVKVQNLTATEYYEEWSFTSEDSWDELCLSNGADFNLVDGKLYDATMWYNGRKYSYPLLQVIECRPSLIAPEAPSITGAETFADSTIVTITADSTATIYYTLDGTDPTVESTQYTEPFKLTVTTTVKAIAVAEGLVSEVATKTFTQKDYETKTIAQLHEQEQSEGPAFVTISDAKVVYAATREDGTRVAILRENGQALDVISSVLDLPLGATVSGKFFANFSNNEGVVSSSDVEGKTNADDLESVAPGEGAENDPVETTVKEVGGYPGDLVLIKGLKIMVSSGEYYGYTESYQFVSLTGDELLSEIKSNQKYDIVGWYNAPGTGVAEGRANLYVVSFTPLNDTKYKDQTVAELNARTDRENNIRLHLDNAKVVYLQENIYGDGTYDIALRQDGKAVVLHGTALDLKLNNTVSGTVKMNFYALSGIPELRDIGDGITNADSLEITTSASEELDATEVTFNDIDEHKADLVIFRKVKIGVDADNQYVIKMDGQEIKFVNEDESLDVDALISDTNEYDVTLWYNSYINGAPYLEIVKAVKLTDVGIYGVEANYGEDGDSYNLQGAKVNKNYRGVVIRNGKKFTRK